MSDEPVTHDQKLAWMLKWATAHGVELTLAGECGFGRECVGVHYHGNYLDYEWYDEGGTYERADPNGDVWTPSDAYHKHTCVAVLGRGENAESQLYDWLKWFDTNGFVFEHGEQAMDPRLGMIGILMGKNRFARLVRKAAA